VLRNPNRVTYPGPAGSTGSLPGVQRLHARFFKKDALGTLFGNRNKTGIVKLFVANLCEKALLPVIIAAKFLITFLGPMEDRNAPRRQKS